ncbi:coiled-coil domain-containing protein 103 [Cephus cinctus]|uniref:Coiled-coil domain-containing protein 103 n=1 Tax=Cephus cinctus TaxID=211228 RepID=A0AAJ7CFG6_CEPCN|nr:coiled-coil domain-containing protein 103 [Cephus cinctus]
MYCDTVHILNQPIDCKSLENELYEAIKADELYKLQNDAKIRAIEQRVPNYDNFKEMVNGAHLKPLERTDMKPRIGTMWNSMSAADTEINNLPSFRPSSQLHTLSSMMNDLEEFEPEIIPETNEKFLKTWRKLPDIRSKYMYLLTTRHVLRDKIFRTEIPVGILGEFMETFVEIISKETMNIILEILTILSECGRFKLSTTFMSNEERKTCRKLFGKLLEFKDIEINISLIDLKSKYLN